MCCIHRCALFVLLPALALALSACDRSASGPSRVQAAQAAQEVQSVETGPTTRVAVVDLDAVAKAVGRDEAINRQVKSATEQINERLREAARQMQEELDAERERLGGESMEEEARARMEKLTARARQGLRNNRATAEMRRNQIRTALINRFREEIRPIAERVARERGAEVVLTTQPGLLWFDSGVDMTGAVITEFRAHPPDKSPQTSDRGNGEAAEETEIEKAPALEEPE